MSRKNNKLAQNVLAQASPITRGLSGDKRADIVIGKSNFGELSPGSIVANKVFNPGGAIVDRSSTPNRTYVFDGGNSRILGYSSLGNCASDATSACTVKSDCSAGSVPIANVIKDATTECSSEYASGWCQKVSDNFHGECNSGEWATASQPTGWVRATWNSPYKVNKVVLYDRACPEQVLSGHIAFSDGSSPVTFNQLEDTGSTGTEVNFSERTVTWIEIWIDTSSGTNVGLSEIEVYGAPADSVQQCNYIQGKPADLVIGQPQTAGYGACNRNGTFQNYPQNSVPSAETLCGQGDGEKSPTEGGSMASLAVDSNGNLYMPDLGNNRVLMYRSPFTSDTIADAVWGQDDFSGRETNKGGSVNASGLNLTGVALAGVDVDPSGNLWVTDVMNHRVLRFPFDSQLGFAGKTADVVLGQDNFTDSGEVPDPGPGPNRMNKPAAVRFDPTTGWLFVADYDQHSATNLTENYSRVLVFKPVNAQFQNGMSAEYFAQNYVVNSQTGETMKFLWPSGIDIDPLGQGIWINDNRNHMVELWNTDGTQVKKVLFKTQLDPGEDYGSGGCTTGNCLMLDPRGSIGLDSEGNIIMTGSNNTQSVWHFPRPPDLVPGNTTLPAADFELTYVSDAVKGKHNSYGPEALRSVRSVVIANNQMIVADQDRILFWNNPLTGNGEIALTNGQPADGFVGASRFNVPGINRSRLKADQAGHLYALVDDPTDSRSAKIEVFNLPLQGNSQDTPIKTLQFPLTLVNGNPIKTYDGSGKVNITSVAPAGVGEFLWVADQNNHRVMRIRNPLGVDPRVDIILGQADENGFLGNRVIPQHDWGGDCTQAPAQDNTMCFPGAVAIDRLGNLHVSDHGLEFVGNFRHLVFNKDLLPTDNSSAIFGLAASQILNNIATYEPSFNLNNHMLVGTNVQAPQGPCGRFVTLLLYSSSTGYSINNYQCLEDYETQIYSTFVDEFDNFYTGGLNWGRVMIYKQPLGGSTPTPIPPTPTLTATPTPTPTPIPQTMTLIPVADTHVRSESPKSKNGSNSKLSIDGLPIRIGFMKFDLSALAGKTIVSARLRFRVANGSINTQQFRFVEDSTWSEKDMTYNTKVAYTDLLAEIFNTKKDVWYEADLTGGVVRQAGQFFSFAIWSGGSDELQIPSRESSYKPNLIVEYY